jgi:hypothetical protein
MRPVAFELLAVKSSPRLSGVLLLLDSDPAMAALVAANVLATQPAPNALLARQVGAHRALEA